MELAVVATHARGPWGRALSGGVADRLVRAAPWPVLAIPAGPGARPPTKAFRRVLVGLDGSKWAEKALTRGLPWFDRGQTHLHLVQVVRPKTS